MGKEAHGGRDRVVRRCWLKRGAATVGLLLVFLPRSVELPGRPIVASPADVVSLHLPVEAGAGAAQGSVRINLKARLHTLPRDTSTAYAPSRHLCLRGGVARERQKNLSWDILSAHARQRLKSAEEDTPASDAAEACEERIATGGIGTISCANFLLEGQPLGMLYEKNEDGEKYKTATLVVGHSMGPMSVLGKGRALSIKSSAAAAAESELTGKQRVYFEPNRHGKWRPVLAPKGMSTRQLLRKVEAEQTFMKSLTLVQRKQMALERERAILHAEAEGLHVVSIPSERGLIKKLKKRKKEIEKTRQRFEDKAKEMAEQKKARDIERERRLKDRRNGSKGVDGKTRMRVGGRSDKRRRVEGDAEGRVLSKMRKTASGGTRRARRTGRHKMKNNANRGQRRRF